MKEMVANLGDRYSAFLIPEEYRLAIRHPLPSELKYLAYRYTGIGMEVKYQSENPCPVKNFEVSGMKKIAWCKGRVAGESGTICPVFFCYTSC